MKNSIQKLTLVPITIPSAPGEPISAIQFVNNGHFWGHTKSLGCSNTLPAYYTTSCKDGDLSISKGLGQQLLHFGNEADDAHATTELVTTCIDSLANKRISTILYSFLCRGYIADLDKDLGRVF